MKLIITLLTFIAAAEAQVPRAQGYVVQGFGTATPGSAFLSQTVAGVEGALVKGFGIGAEVGAIYSFDGGVIGIFNAGGNYHFTAGRKDTKWDPFVAAGYSMPFRSGVIHGFHYGGGVGYWFHPKIGIRAEFRDIRIGQGREGFPSFRIGVTFR